MKKWLVILIIVMVIGLVIYFVNENFLSKSTDSKKEYATTISDIAYDSNNDFDYRIYIKENDKKYTPFIVLTSKYNDSCLLLRERLLDNLEIYNFSSDRGSYYEDSKIDQYLSSDYYTNLSKELKDKILKTQLEITARESIGSQIKEKKNIERKVFLLSAYEIHSSLSSIVLNEGQELLYFKNAQNYLALHEDGEADTWYLRTPDISNYNSIITVSYLGSVGNGGLNGMDGVVELAVRPAFCIDNDTKITQRDDIVEGKTVFCIE